MVERTTMPVAPPASTDTPKITIPTLPFSTDHAATMPDPLPASTSTPDPNVAGGLPTESPFQSTVGPSDGGPVMPDPNAGGGDGTPDDGYPPTDDAVEALRQMFIAYGMTDIGDWLAAQIIAGKNMAQISTEIYDQPSYKRYFPAMDALRKKGHAVTESQYLEMEQSYRQAFQMSELPARMWDSPDDFRRLMEAEVSPLEVQRRIAAAKEAVTSTDPNTRLALRQMYGITTGDLMAYALDPVKNSDYLKKVATTSILAGYSKTSGMVGLSKASWEAYAQDLINQQVGDEGIRQIVAEANVLATQQQRLAGIEGERFTTADAMDVTVRRDAKKTLASQRRADREKARFSGSQGVGTGSLSGGSI